MENPIVSFVVPCYKLAHLLPECINSILSQTYKNFEVLIMDDCSPDNTAEVAQSFQDPRVIHIRNDPNLGHLQNYNKGISLSRGKFVWLISADDYLRRSYVLEKYVGLMDKHPDVGYVFCPGFGVRDGIETRLLGRFSNRRDQDQIITSYVMLKKLLQGNFVLTPSGMVRRECYEKITYFPLNMPWAGDWYLWSIFALYNDVGYFAEPMLCYREHHEHSMTYDRLRNSLDENCAEEIEISWNIRMKAQEKGSSRLDKLCLNGVAHTYARAIASERYRESSFFMNFEFLEKSLGQYALSETQRDWIRAQVYASVGDERYWHGDLASTKKFYQRAIEKNPLTVTIYLKMLLLFLGKSGDFLRKAIFSFS